MDHATIRHIKLLAKRLKKENSNLSYCQCLDLITKRSYGARHFHELQRSYQQTDTALITRMPTDLRYNDWPYFDLPQFSKQTTQY